MKIGSWTRLLLAAAPLVACFMTGCGDFWECPSCGTNTSFALSASPASLTVAPGATTGNTSTISVTPSNSFTGTVALTCAVTSTLSNPTLPGCSLSPTSVSITGTTAETSLLTVTTAAGTTLGAYTITITGTSGSVAANATVCAEVSTSSATCAASATTSGDFYILNGGTTGSITGYFVNSSGLNKIGSSVLLTGVTPVAMAIAPNGNFLIVSTSSSGVFAYPITNGAVGSTGVQVTEDPASSVQIDTTSSWLLEAVPLVGSSVGVTLNAVPISSTTGAYTKASIYSLSLAVPNASLPNGQMAISGDDKNVFVALETGGTAVVPFDTANADPLPAAATSAIVIGVAHTGGSALSVAVDPGATPGLFYIGETLANSGTAGGLRAFTYASLSTPTALVQASGSPIASGELAPTQILPITSSDSGYIYVADEAGSITGFEITSSGSTYTISTGSTVSAGDQPLGMAVDSTGSFVFEVGSSGSPYFDAYALNATTGQLTSQVTSTSPAASVAIVAMPATQ